MDRTFALIAAGGSGNRFGKAFPKQFSEIQGNTVLEACIASLRDSDLYDHLVVSVPSAYESRIRRRFDQHLGWGDVLVISGGEQRRDSMDLLTEAAVDFWGIEPSDVVSLVDANRPLTTTATYETSIDLARKHGASCPILRLADGLAEVTEESEISRIIPQGNYVRFVTPESFQWQTYLEVPDRVKNNRALLGFVPMFVKSEITVKTFLTDWFSLKITYPEDWSTFIELRDLRRKDHSGPEVLEFLAEGPG